MKIDAKKMYQVSGTDLLVFLTELANEFVSNEVEQFELGFAAGATQASDNYEDEIKELLARRTECSYNDGFGDAMIELDGRESDAFDEGYAEGFEDGNAERSEDLADARADGYTDGYDDGFEAGMEEARAEMSDTL